MRDFNQAALDARLAELTANLSPEEAVEVQQRVHQRLESAGGSVDATAVEGAFDLIGLAVDPGVDASGLPDKIGALAANLDPRRLSLPDLDVTGLAGDAIGGAIGGLGRLFGGAIGLKDSATGAVGRATDALGGVGDGALGQISGIAANAGNLGSGVLGKAGDLLGGAAGAGKGALDAAAGLAGRAGDMVDSAGVAVDALGGLVGGGAEIGASALGAAADLAGNAIEAVDLAEIVLTVLGEVLSGLGDL